MREAKLADILRAPKVRVRIGDVPAGAASRELIASYPLRSVGEVLEFEVPPDMLAVVRIAHAP